MKLTFDHVCSILRSKRKCEVRHGWFDDPMILTPTVRKDKDGKNACIVILDNGVSGIAYSEYDRFSTLADGTITIKSDEDGPCSIKLL